jgi:hypothetical protein
MFLKGSPTLPWQQRNQIVISTGNFQKETIKNFKGMVGKSHGVNEVLGPEALVSSLPSFC